MSVGCHLTCALCRDWPLHRRYVESLAMTFGSAAVAFIGQVLKLQSLHVFVGYLLMVALSGPWRQMIGPFTNLRPILILHNFVCCFASICTFGGFAYCVLQSGSLYSRQTSDTLTWFFTLYWVTKELELLDTVFMILRHKTRQISFLHVFHHSSMLLLSDLSRSFYALPCIAVFLGMNSFVHIVMYLYYGLAALSPENPPTWKKLMTQVQIGQFLVGLVISILGYLYHNFCIYSILYGITMTWLFSNFYYHAYVKKR